MTSKLKELTARATLISVIAVMVFATTSVMAYQGTIDGKDYFALALLVGGALFKDQSAKS